ncbi:DEAD/DEAH box helicase family protein [Ochrobactrum tritici]|uniref:DEAD/DEAH box helicase family protein n=1 Tax=Brucella tritici TaxID=94626 RepID=A0A7X6FSF3_9HYPH|nr:DEAD/DEAH box helicase family protein [Brucella tritici]
MSGFKLRPYQAEMVTETRDALRDVQSVLDVMATGGGKTAISGFMAGSASRRNRKVIFGVHRKELIRQTAKPSTRLASPTVS